MLTELTRKSEKQLQLENEELRARLAEANETLDAIRNGEVDAIVVSGLSGEKIFSISSAETPYRVIIEEMNEGAVVLSADGVVLYCNHRFAELVSIAPEQIIGSWFSQLFPKNDIQKYNDLLQAGLNGKTDGEISYIKDDNTSPIHLHLSFSPLPAGMLGDVCIMASDISELKLKEEELCRSHESLEQQIIERTAELTKTVEELANSQRAALKMMDDAVEAKNTLAILNKDLAFQNAEKEKQATALHESELRFRLLFENMVEGVALHEMIYDDAGIPIDYRIVDVNSAFEKQTGISGQSARGALATVLYGVETAPYLVEYSGVVLSGKSISFETYFPNLKKTFSISAVSTKPGYFATIFQDITERKQAEERLKASEEKFLKAFQNSPNTIIITRIKDGKIIEVNDSFISMSGITRKEAMLSSSTSLNLWANIEDRNWVLSALKDGIEVKNKEFQFIIKNGNRINGLFSAQVVHLTDEPCVLSSILDITERKLAEQSLLESEKKFSDIVKQLDEGYYSVTVDGILLEHNLAFNRILGIDINRDLKGEKTPDFWQNPNTRVDYLKELMANGSIKNYEVDAKTLSGEKITVILNSHLIKDNDGKLIRIEGIVLDVTERKRAYEKLLLTLENLERSNKDLEQFAYVASHDLQEPLRLISSYTQLLERKYKDQLDADAQEFIQYAVQGANRMQKLINDLLDYSRITNRGKEFEKIDTYSVFGKAVSNLQQLIIDNSALITNADLPIVKADEPQIVRLFQNLIENALKYKKETESPQIHISCTKKNNLYEFSVKDNGIGIDMQYSERIFIIFQRLHSIKDYPGTGIGLSICKRIVERHGGTIWLESKINEGTTFYFTLSA